MTLSTHHALAATTGTQQPLRRLFLVSSYNQSSLNWPCTSMLFLQVLLPKKHAIISLLAVMLVSFFTPVASTCVAPSGINESSDGISLEHVTSLLNGTALGSPLPHLFMPLAEPIIGVLSSSFETPIQFRQALYHGTTCYNTAAMYHTTALDIWGHGEKRICLDHFTSEDEKHAHEQVALVYTFALSATLIAPDSKDIIMNIMDNILKLPMSKVFEDESDSSTIDTGTPWGLARANVEQMSEYAKSDGWNYDGSLLNAFNKMPFSDFDYKEYSAYKPSDQKISSYSQKNQEKAMCDKEWHWEPLLETNGNGYFTKQEHVTPFAGFTGRLYGMTIAEYANFSVSEPQYDYCEETDFVLSETDKMATDNKKKCELEFFDSKFTSLLPMQIEWSLQNRVSSFDFWFYDMALVTAMYDATMLVWREKVAFNAVRPTTVVHAMKGEEVVQTYAGPYAGSKMIKGKDWQPYIRTMPHAEYPSGSSCICTTFVETLQLLTGHDETGQFPVGGSFKAGSSKTEPGATPAHDLDLTYTKWSEVQHACGQSRLYGGMHFSSAVPAGEELCTGVASLVVDRVELLRSGDANGALADLDDTSITVKLRQTNGLSCDDSPLKVLTKKERKSARNCLFIANKKSEKLCQGNVIKSHCPKSCGVCDLFGLTDSQGTFLFKGKNRDCKWLHDLVTPSTLSKVSYWCQIDAIRETCRNTCSFFRTNPM